MWNNNTAKVYKALTLLADKMICWYRARDCFPYDTCHYFPPLLVPGHLHTYGKGFRKRMNGISLKSNPKNLLLGIWNSLYYAQKELSIPVENFLNKLAKKEHVNLFLKNVRKFSSLTPSKRIISSLMGWTLAIHSFACWHWWSKQVHYITNCIQGKTKVKHLNDLLIEIFILSLRFWFQQLNILKFFPNYKFYQANVSFVL